MWPADIRVEGDLLTLGVENITEEGIEIVLGKSRRKVTRRGKLVERARRIIVTRAPELRQIVGQRTRNGACKYLKEWLPGPDSNQRPTD
jgi:hypothetical protein